MRRIAQRRASEIELLKAKKEETRTIQSRQLLISFWLECKEMFPGKVGNHSFSMASKNRNKITIGEKRWWIILGLQFTLSVR